MAITISGCRGHQRHLTDGVFGGDRHAGDTIVAPVCHGPADGNWLPSRDTKGTCRIHFERHR